MVPVHIRIESIIHEETGEEPQVIRQEWPGRLQVKESGEWVLRYLEHVGTPEEVRTAVKALPGEVTVVRQGAISYRQTYRPGEKRESVVTTPAGTTRMEVTTLSCYRDRTDGEGRIAFSFLLTMGEQKLGHYELRITWTEEQVT